MYFAARSGWDLSLNSKDPAFFQKPGPQHSGFLRIRGRVNSIMALPQGPAPGHPFHDWLLPITLLLVSFASAPGTAQEQQPARPNLLVLMADDHAAYTLGADGNSLGATPRLDKLAQEGTYFSRTFCVSPLCTPSRQAFLTGQYPHAVGVTALDTPLNPDALTMAAWLRAHGYATAAVGKMHFNNNHRHGFDQLVDTPSWQHNLKKHPPADGVHRPAWLPLKQPPAQWLNAGRHSTGLSETDEEATFFADTASRYLHNHRHQPIFLMVSLHEPHAPFVYPREWHGRYQPEQFPVRPVSPEDQANLPAIFGTLSRDEKQGIQAAYYTSLAYADSQLGRVLDALEAEGLAENTLVVYWSDNGYLLGHHGRFEKHAMYEEAVRVPLIVRWPGKLPAHQRVDQMIETTDLFPTLMTLIGLPTPTTVQGRDMAPLFRNQPGALGRAEVFSEYLPSEEAMIRTDRYKLVVCAGMHERSDGYRSSKPLKGPTIRLFDLQADPGETIDLSRDPAQLSRIQEMQQLLLERFRGTWPSKKRVPQGMGDDHELAFYLTSSEVRLKARGQQKPLRLTR